MDIVFPEKKTKIIRIFHAVMTILNCNLYSMRHALIDTFCDLCQIFYSIIGLEHLINEFYLLRVLQIYFYDFHFCSVIFTENIQNTDKKGSSIYLKFLIFVQNYDPKL